MGVNKLMRTIKMLTHMEKDPLLKNSLHKFRKYLRITSSWPLYKENQTYKNAIFQEFLIE